MLQLCVCKIFCGRNSTLPYSIYNTASAQLLFTLSRLAPLCEMLAYGQHSVSPVCKAPHRRLANKTLLVSRKAYLSHAAAAAAIRIQKQAQTNLNQAYHARSFFVVWSGKGQPTGNNPFQLQAAYSYRNMTPIVLVRIFSHV